MQHFATTMFHQSHRHLISIQVIMIQKGKRFKSQPLSSGLLKSHAEALLSLLKGLVIKSSPAWKEIAKQ